MKKWIPRILLCTALVGLFCLPTSASNVITDGYCGYDYGENVTWTLYSDGTLVLDGTGRTDYYGGYYFRGDAPWTDHADEIKTIRVEGSITELSSGLFDTCSSATELILGTDTITEIALDVFPNNASLERITTEYEGGTYLAIDGVLYGPDYIPDTWEKTFSLLYYPPQKQDEEFSLPFGVEMVSSFGGNNYLEVVHLNESLKYVGYSAFSYCASLTRVDNMQGVTVIEACAFEGCSSLEDLELPSTLKNLDTSAFWHCDLLKEIAVLESVEVFGCEVTNGGFWMPDEMDSKSFYFKGDAPSGFLDSLEYGNSELSFKWNKEVGMPELMYTDIYYPREAQGWAEQIERYEQYIEERDYEPSIRFYSYSLKEKIASGYCGGEGDGTNLTWTLYEDGELVISGAGAMADWITFDDNAPWYANRDSIKTVTIEDGVTSIEGIAFADCYALTSVMIPDSVISIGDCAFDYCGELTDVIIPDSVTSIGWYAFYACDSLSKVTIGTGVVSIGGGAFEGCNSLRDIYFQGDAPEISGMSFDSAVTLYYAPDRAGWSTPEWNGYAVYVYVDPDWRASIVVGETSHGTLRVDKTSAAYQETVNVTAVPENGYQLAELYINGVLFSGTEFSVPYTETVIVTARFLPEGTSITQVPLDVAGLESEHDYSNNANQSWRISHPGARSISLTFDSSTEFEDSFDFLYIYDGAGVQVGEYSGTELAGTTVTVEGDSVELKLVSDGSVSRYGFKVTLAVAEVLDADPDWRASIVVGETSHGTLQVDKTSARYQEVVEVTPIPDEGYQFVELYINGQVVSGTSFSVPYSDTITVTALFSKPIAARGYCGGEGDGTNLTWILTEDGTLTIAGKGKMVDYNSVNYLGNIWHNQYITNVIIENGVTNIGGFAFYDQESLSSVSISDSVTSIGERAFYGCDGLAEVTIPNSVISIGEYAFSGCSSLSSMTIPNSVTTLGERAFEWCDGLTSVTLGNSMSTIGSSAFNHCAELTTVYYTGDLAGWCGIYFGNVASNGMMSADKLYINGELIAGDLVIPDGVTSIGHYVFCECDSLTSVIIPDSVISIDGGAFYCCDRLSRVDMGEGVTRIGKSAFSLCPLVAVTIPDSVLSIGDGAFEWDYELSVVRFLGDAPEIDYSFAPNVTVYYSSEKSGWSTPTWNGYAAYPIVSADNSESTQTNTDSYYSSKIEKHGFGFRKEDGNSWLDQVTVSQGEQSFFSGDKSYLFAELAASDPMEMVTFQRSDYRDVQLPVCVLDESTNIVFYPQSQTDPFVQNVYARIDEKTEFGKVIRGGTLTLHAGNLQERVSFYIDVDWGNMGPGKLYLSQSTDPEDGIEVFEGMNEGLSISAYLDSSNAFYLIMEFADGSHMGQKLGISVLAQQLEQEINLGENIDVPTPNIEALSSFKFGIELPKNFDISLSVKKDGTVKGVLGLKGLEAKEVDKCFDSIKDELADSQVKNEFGHFLKTFKNGGFQIPPKSSKFVVSADVQLLGYVEGKLIETENGKQDIQFTEGGIGVVVEGKVENTWQLYAFGAPFYACLSISPSLEFTTAVCTENGVVQADPIDLKGEAKLKAKGGLGLDSMATVGIYGKGSIVFKHRSPGTKEDLKLYVNASIGAEAEFFAFSADLELLKFNDFYLYGSPNTRMRIMSAASINEVLENADWQPQSRDYLYAVSPMALDEDSTLSGGETVVNMVYPYANVQHAVLPDGTQIMVWTADPGTRQEDNNRTVLYYAYHDGDSWSAPAPVEAEDDGTADFNPVLQVLDDAAYLFWQDASQALTAADDVTTTAAVVDISCAVFDAENGSFTGLGTVGSEYYDGAVSATVMDGKPAVIWASNSTNSPLSASGKAGTLYRAVWDGEQWNTSVLAEELGAIDQTAANGSNVWFSADTDFNGATMNDREIFLYGGTLIQLTDNEIADTKPMYENNTLFWYSGGSVVTADEKTIPLAEDTDRYQYVVSGNGMEAVTYVVTDENRVSTLYASFNDGTGWGDPIQLVGGNGNIGNFSAQFLSDGTLSVAVRERSVTLPEDECDIARLSSAAQIKTYTVTPVCDLTVEGVDYLAHSLVSGGTLDVMFDVHNAGMTAVELMKVSVLDGEDVLHEGVYEVNLLSGQSDTLFVAVPLPEYIPESMALQVSAIGYTDATAEDNSTELELRLQDISLESAAATSDGEATQVTVLAVNRGQQDLDGVTLSLTDEDGTALDSKTDLTLAAGESQFITFDLEQAYANNTLLKVAAFGLEAENIMANNSAVALVSAVPEGKLTLTASYLRTETSLKVVTELDNTTDESCSYSFYCALYNEDGQQLAVQSLTEQFTAGADNNMVQFTFDGNWSDVATIKVFALKSGAEPLTGNAQVSVEQ